MRALLLTQLSAESDVAVCSTLLRILETLDGDFEAEFASIAETQQDSAITIQAEKAVKAVAQMDISEVGLAHPNESTSDNS